MPNIIKKGFLLLCFLLTTQVFAQQGAIENANEALKQAKKVVDRAQKFQKTADSIFATGIGNAIAEGVEASLPLRVPFSKNTKAADSQEPYQFGLHSLKIHPTYNTAALFLKLNRSVFANGADNGPPIYFAADEIRFTKNGGFTGDARLFLVTDFDIRISEDVKLKVYAINPTNSTVTSIRFDCNGFQKMHLSASLIVNPSVATLEDAAGKPTQKPVEIVFETDIDDLGGWIVEINKIPMFQFTNLPNFSWAVTSMVYDNSSSANSADMKNVPTNFEESIPGSWKGFYCKKVVVAMPKYLKTKDAPKGERMKITGKSLLLDNGGFSGDLSVSPIFENGDMGKWKYSIQELQGRIRNSALEEFYFKGEMDMPLASDEVVDGKKKGLAYTAGYAQTSEGTKLRFAVQTLEKKNFEFLKVAKVEDLVTRMEMQVGENDLQAALVVSGKLTVSPNVKDKSKTTTTTAQDTIPSMESPSLLTIKFTELRVQSQKPYVSIGGAELESEAAKSRLAKLPIKIEDVSAKSVEDLLEVSFHLSVQFMEGTSGFSGKTKLAIYSYYNGDDNRLRFQRVDVGSVCIDFGNNSYSMKGCVNFFDDGKGSTWGQGFTGDLEGKFAKKIEVKVTAMFGKAGVGENDMCYWYVDAGVKFPKAIPIFTGVGINGFYGGAYYNMTLDENGTCTKGQRGCNASGIKFKPMPDKLGVRAGISIVSSPTETAFSGTLIFGVEMDYKKQSISKISFDGMVKIINTEVLTDQTALTSASKEGSLPTKSASCESGMSVDWKLTYIVEEQILTGSFGTKVKYDGIIQGNYEQCSAGTSEIYFSPKDWYVYLGRPADGARLSFNIYGIFNAESYFIMGSKLPTPAIAPLPAGYGQSSLDPTLLGTGGGFGFGVRGGASKDLASSRKFGSCEVRGGVYAGFEAGLDVLIARDKDPIGCGGYGERGINRWYATGQAFVSAWGTVKGGASCKGFGFDVELAELDFKAAVMAQLPRPTYLEGFAKVGFSILGLNFTNSEGSSGKLEIKFNYGDRCSRDQVDTKGFAVIDRVSPLVIDETISPYSGPRLTLKQAVGTEFYVKQSTDVVKDGPLGNSRLEAETTQVLVAVQTPGISKVRFKTIKDGNNWTDATVPFTTKMENDGHTVSFAPVNALAKGFYEVTLSVPFSNNSSESVKIEFGVEEEPESLPLDIVSYAYPLPTMTNFYRLTGKEGYIRLRSNPSKPVTPPAGYVYAVNFYEIATSRFVTKEKVSYVSNPATGKPHLTYTIPSQLLKNATQYRLEVVKTPQTTFANKPLSGDLLQGNAQSIPSNDIKLLEYTFTTSKFSSFEEKMAAYAAGKIQKVGEDFYIPLSAKSETKAAFETEAFSTAELDGYTPQSGEQLPASIQVYGVQTAVNDELIANEPSYHPLDPNEPRTFPYLDGVEIKSVGEDGYEIQYRVPSYISRAYQGSVPARPIIKTGFQQVKMDYYLPAAQKPEASYTVQFEVQ